MNAIKPVLRFFMDTGVHQLRFDVSMLIFRLFLGFFMAAGHGWGKLANFSERADSFPDPMGVGSPLSLALAVMAEFFASIAVALGLFTRFALISLIITMFVAGFIIHANDPLFGQGRTKELALMYLFPYIVLFLVGPGRFSADHYLGRMFLK